MKSIFLFLTVLTISGLGMAEGLNSFSTESKYCDYIQGVCKQIEIGKIEATRKANLICSPQYAAQISDWINFEKNVSPTHSTRWVKAMFVCANSRSDDGIVCRKIGTSYTVKCCDNSGSCWIE